MAFQRILVPLDGSALAERALEPAFCVGQAFGSQVILLRVTMPVETAVALSATSLRFSDIGNLQIDLELQSAEDYLRQTAARWPSQNTSIRTQVVVGAPAQRIVEAAREAGVDLIVMSTHGRSGIERLLYGSIAEAVLRGAKIPVMLIPSRIPDGADGR